MRKAFRRMRAAPEGVVHPLDPVFDAGSRVLVLGTMPSPRSRETGFYYGHPTNRFWRVLSAAAGQPEPIGREEKVSFLRRHHIAMWDVLASCRIAGAADVTIRDPVANDLSLLLRAAPIHAVFTTGRAATALYERLCLPSTGIPARSLPSTSAANQGRWHEADLVEAYRAVIGESLRNPSG